MPLIAHEVPMSATPKTGRKQVRKAAKPVTETLLELAYFLHTTKVVGVRETPNEPRGQKSPHGRPQGEGSALAS